MRHFKKKSLDLFSIMLKIGAKSIHSDVHINQISNFVCHKPLPFAINHYQTGMKQPTKFHLIGAYRLQKYKHTYIVLLQFRDDACKRLKFWPGTSPQITTLRDLLLLEVYTAPKKHGYTDKETFLHQCNYLSSKVVGCQSVCVFACLFLISVLSKDFPWSAYIELG